MADSLKGYEIKGGNLFFITKLSGSPKISFIMGMKR